MNIIVTGGGGFLGSRIIRRLLARKDAGTGGTDFERVVSIDMHPCPVDDERVESVVVDISAPDVFNAHIDGNTVGIFHLAAVLSGGSEEDFDLAFDVNVNATRSLLEAARASGNSPRVVFTSSLAVFGGDLPSVVTDSQAVQPESTYGASKAIGELLVNEYSRKGYIDGRVCRVPTIAVRPGRPNSAASSFASGIIREPLAGERSVLPVPKETRLWLSSPDAAVRNLIDVFELAPARLPAWRVINLPGITVSAAEMLETLERDGGAKLGELVDHKLDQRIMNIVGTWPEEFDLSSARALGLVGDASFAEIYQQYVGEFV